jgi:hypothetical protein
MKRQVQQTGMHAGGRKERSTENGIMAEWQKWGWTME